MVERLIWLTIIVVAPILIYAFASAMQIEEMKQWPMSRFCENGFTMACGLHPDCKGVALMCFPHPDKIIDRLQTKEKEPSND